MNYLIIIEPTETGFSAYSPDLAGCVATGGDEDEVLRNMQAALDFHIEGLRNEGLPVPMPECKATTISV